MFLSAGHRSDYLGAKAMLSSLPKAKTLIADRGYDADWFRWALADRGVAACIPARRGRKVPIPHDPALYRQRHRIETAFGRLKDWRRLATRHDRCPIAFLSACAPAAVVLFWLRVLNLGPIDIQVSQIMVAARWAKPAKWMARRS